MKKRLDQLNTDELLKKLENSEFETSAEEEYIEETLDTVPLNPDEKLSLYVEDFLRTFDIKPGEQYIKKRLLCKLFKKWSGKYFLKNDSISTHLGNYLPIGGALQFKIDINAFVLNKKLLKLLYKRKNEFAKFHVVKHQKTFEHFLKYHKITAGNNSFPLFMLYYIFDLYSYKQKANVISKNVFHKICKSMFDYHRPIWKKKFQPMCVYINVKPEQILSEKEISELEDGYEWRIKKFRKDLKGGKKK